MPPLFEPMVEDEDAERQEEEEDGDGERDENQATWHGDETFQLKREGMVNGGKFRMKKRVIGVRRRVF